MGNYIDFMVQQPSRLGAGGPTCATRSGHQCSSIDTVASPSDRSVVLGGASGVRGGPKAKATSRLDVISPSYVCG